MRKILLLTLASVLAFTAISCASTKKKADPLWIDLETLPQIYPSTEYIARIGYGESAQEARVLSEAELTSYFEHSVKSETKSTYSQSMKDGVTSQGNRSLSHKVNVSAEMSLFAVNHTKPWYDKENRQYVCCSFIERKEAWKFYESQVLQRQKRFFADLENAEKEEDPLKKILLLTKAEESGSEYEDTLDFAHALYEQGSLTYEKDRSVLASVPAKKEKARLEASMKISVTGDKDGIIKRKVSAVFSEKGFILTEASPAYEVKVTVSENKSYYESSITAVPGISIEISNGKESIFTYAKTLERQTGFKEAEAFVEKKIFSSLEKELDSTLGKELDASLFIGKN